MKPKNSPGSFCLLLVALAFIQGYGLLGCNESPTEAGTVAKLVNLSHLDAYDSTYIELLTPSGDRYPLFEGQPAELPDPAVFDLPQGVDRSNFTLLVSGYRAGVLASQDSIKRVDGVFATISAKLPHVNTNTPDPRSPDSLSNELKQLHFTTGNLTPAFDPDTLSYNLKLPLGTEAFTWTAVGKSQYAFLSSPGMEGNPVGLIGKRLVGTKVDTLLLSVANTKTGLSSTYRIAIVKAVAIEGGLGAGDVVCRLEISDTVLNLGNQTSLSGESFYFVFPFDADSVTVALKDVSQGAVITLDHQKVTGQLALRPQGNTLGFVLRTAYQGDSAVYHFSASRAPNPSARLSSLSVTPGSIKPAFEAAEKAYVLTLPHDADSVGVTAWFENPSARARLEGKDIQHGMELRLALAGDWDSRKWNLDVTGVGETGNRYTYTLTLSSQNRALSAEHRLKSLTPSAGTLTPAFSMDVWSYMLPLSASVDSVRFEAEPTDVNATSRTFLWPDSTSPRKSFPLHEGSQTIAIRVIAENGSQGDYLVEVTRAASTKSDDTRLKTLSLGPIAPVPAFDAMVRRYTATVPYDTAGISLSAKVEHAGAHIQWGALERAEIDTRINLPVPRDGRDTVLEVALVVLAENGKKDTTRVNITRKASPMSSVNILKSLSLSGADGDIPATLSGESYQAQVPFRIRSLTLKAVPLDGKSSLKVDEAPLGWNVSSPGYPLVEGGNTFALKVTAEDGGEKNYLLIVNREKSSPPKVDAGGTVNTSLGGKVQLQGKATDNGSIVSWKWKVGGGAWTASSDGSHTFTAPNQVTKVVCSLKVEDDDGEIGIGITTVQVQASPPKADAGSDRTVAKGTTVELVGTETSGQSVKSWEWKIGSGSWQSSSDGKRSFVASTPGAVVCSLKVTDSDGESAYDAVVITVTSPPLIVSIDVGGDAFVRGEARLGARVVGDGIVKVHAWRIAGGTWTIGPADTTILLPELPGDLKVELRVVDTDDQTFEASKTLKVPLNPRQGSMVLIPWGGKSFWMEAHEVTRASYRALMTKHYQQAAFPVSLPLNEETHPIAIITWGDAIAYCNARSSEEDLQPVYGWSALTWGSYDFGSTPQPGHVIGVSGYSADLNRNGYRLPTMEEWEHAARNNAKTTYAWGMDLELDYCNLQGTTSGTLYPVKSLKPTPWGLYDIFGNVWEYVHMDRLVTKYPMRGGSFSWTNAKGTDRTLTFSSKREIQINYGTLGDGFRVVRRAD